MAMHLEDNRNARSQSCSPRHYQFESCSTGSRGVLHPSNNSLILQPCSRLRNTRNGMRIRPLGLAAITVALVGIAMAAVAFGPANLAKLGSPSGPNAPQGSSITKPTWRVGDTWTYHVNSTPPDVYVTSPTWESPSLTGTLTRTVASADASQYNVTVHGSFHLESVFDAARDGGETNTSTLLLFPPVMQNATVDGYALYRASDLAELKEVRTVHLKSSLWTARGWFNASYTATVQTTYDPALDIWAFPLGENETWNVSSNATIHAMIAWRFDGPNESFGFWHTFDVTAPIRLMLHSGEIQDVTTPAGTFSSIPVRVALPTIDRLTTDDREGPVVGLGGDECGRPRLAAEAWFSGDVGNVVKAVTFIGGMKIVAELASFHRA